MLSPAPARYLQRHLALANEVKEVSFFALPKDQLSGIEMNVRGAPHQQLDVLSLATLQEGMLYQHAFNGLRGPHPFQYPHLARHPVSTSLDGW